MAEIIICPWCQSELIQEEGQAPDKFCPVCDNELSGYRSLQFGVGPDEEIDDEEEEVEDEAGDEEDGYAVPGLDDENLILEQDGELRGKNEALLRYEETVEALLDEQDFVPECPQCREYMVETGQRSVAAGEFSPRLPELLQGAPVLQAPFTMALYLCPSCFTMQYMLTDADRSKVAQRLSGDSAGSGGQ